MKLSYERSTEVINSVSSTANVSGPKSAAVEVSPQDLSNAVSNLTTSFGKRIEHYCETTLKSIFEDQRKTNDPCWSRGDELPILSFDYENQYSDWLSWCLSKNGKTEDFGNVLTTLFGDEFGNGESFSVTREEVVDYVDDNGSGRLDLELVSTELKRFQVIEVKVRDPSDRELKKNSDYIKAIEQKYPEWEGSFSLLIPDSMEFDADKHDWVDRYNVISWREVATRIRKYLLNDNGELNQYDRAILGLFCCSIEYKLLGFPSDLLRTYLRDGQIKAPWALSSNGFLAYLGEAYEL